MRPRAIVLNKSMRAMPISFGFHPAFRWPLPYRGSRRDHEFRFEGGESAPIRRLTGGLVDVTASKEIFEGSIMPRDEGMLVPGALMFDDLKSRAVNFGVQGRPSIEVRFAEMPHLGLWTKRVRVCCALSPGRVMRPRWDLQVISDTNPAAC